MTERVVVIGHGMVAGRFLIELDSRQLDAEVTVLGDEPHPAYNRLLLAEAIRGRYDLDDLLLPASAGVRVERSRSAVAIDRPGHRVIDDTGATHRYDTLVLATGAAPVFPTVHGLVGPDGLPLQGVTALRTWSDAERIRSAIGAGAVRRVVVAGGGLLGVEAACAMAAAGVEVTVVHRGRQPLDRQLDATSGAVLGLALADQGVQTCTGVRVAQVDRLHERIRQVRLSDTSVLPCDLLVVATGVAPRAELAAAADLWVRHGVLVNDRMRTDDPSIYAIGDCAETAAGVQGLIGPGWQQAAVLADHLAARAGGRRALRAVPPADSGVVRLKADGLDVVSMGRPCPDDFTPDGPRVLSLLDVQDRRSVRVAVEDGRIVGAVVVGDARVAADLTIAYENRLPVPDDPAALLAAPLQDPVAAADVAELPAEAVVCRCNAVTKGTICAAIEHGAASADAVALATRATTGCGSCLSDVCRLLEAAPSERKQKSVA